MNHDDGYWKVESGKKEKKNNRYYYKKQTCRVGVQERKEKTLLAYIAFHLLELEVIKS